MRGRLLKTKAYDHERSVEYWEVFDRRRRLKRLPDFVETEKDHVSRDARYDLIRQVIAKVAAMHAIDAAHLDIGSHSDGLSPSTAKLSHLMAAKYPQIAALAENRYRFLSALKVPEDVLGGGDDPKRKDVFLLGVVAHHWLSGGLQPQPLPLTKSPSGHRRSIRAMTTLICTRGSNVRWLLSRRTALQMRRKRCMRFHRSRPDPRRRRLKGWRASEPACAPKNKSLRLILKRHPCMRAIGSMCGSARKKTM